MMAEKCFTAAREIASESDFLKRTHLGCIAVYKGKIIGKGSNSEKTHPMQMRYNRYRKNYSVSAFDLPKVHAEIKCLSSISKMDINFSKVQLYIYRIGNKNPFGLSRPCPACMKAIRDFGIRQIYYTTNDGFACEKLL